MIELHGYHQGEVIAVVMDSTVTPDLIRYGERAL
ncbi:hypothetical protein E3G69_003171 [Mycobacteroides abscessus]|nr:hypothetical protein [Mycobacteroides abscessus]QOF44122.1 hypothetical protein E3G69_003171 [Mycobacteroides abscessus]QOF48821.1 hypothetical protein E3G70_003170 [Mycobacteroides abscessus]